MARLVLYINKDNCYGLQLTSITELHADDAYNRRPFSKDERERKA